MMRSLAGLPLLFLPVLACAQTAVSTQSEQVFGSPRQAVEALKKAAASGDQQAMGAIFGPDYRDLLTGDAAQDEAHLKRFSDDLSERTELVRDSSYQKTLEVGKNGWAFPIPLIKGDAGWYFDTAAGKDEILNRRIGKDELDAIGVCRAYAAADARQRARLEARPVHGYIFKPLPADQDGGFVLIAYPEKWDATGVMTFLVGANGVVYKHDWGQDSAAMAAQSARFDSKEWRVEQDKGTPITFKKPA